LRQQEAGADRLAGGVERALVARFRIGQLLPAGGGSGCWRLWTISCASASAWWPIRRYREHVSRASRSGRHSNWGQVGSRHRQAGQPMAWTGYRVHVQRKRHHL